MKASVEIACRTLIRKLLRLFFIFPIRQNRIMMSSYNHAIGYTCNPKYICEYLKRFDPNGYELIWAYEEPEKWHIKGTRSVRMHSLSWLYYLLTSSVVIYNRNPEAYLPKRRGQLVINTWHAGGAYKKVGFENATLGKLDLWRARQINDYVDLFLSSCEAFTRSNIEGYHYTGEVLNSGMPRNDFFFRPKAVSKVSARVRATYGAKADSLVILYAPTYRRNVTDPQARGISFPYEKVTDALADADVRIWRREHHEDFNTYEEGNAVDVSAHPDMQDLLAAADILITDYSSSIWDFALLGRPCFLYVPDLEDYIDRDRGFFTPIEEWPGFICRNDAELLEALKACARDEEPFSRADAAEKAARHLAALGSYEDGYASERVCRRIREWVENR